MKAELKPAPRRRRPRRRTANTERRSIRARASTDAILVKYGGVVIAELTGADGPGVRIMSRHKLTATADVLGGVHVLTVEVSE